jgi:hypothetical protein
VLVAENELEKALDFFKFALTASPNVSLFWANYIDTLAKLERIVEAKALIKAVCRVFCLFTLMLSCIHNIPAKVL